MSNLTPFYLRSDFHEEIGWRDFVRDEASLNPLVIREIIANRHRYDFGHDPRTVIERWEPYTLSHMLYCWLIRPGQASPSFVISDGIFTMCMDPLPNDEHLVGLAADLLDLTHETLEAAGGSVKPSPVLPVLGAARVASANVLPGQLVVHRYHDSVAYLRPCLATLQAMAADPHAWARREPGPEAFRGVS